MPDNPPPNPNYPLGDTPAVVALNIVPASWCTRGNKYMVAELLYLFQLMEGVLSIRSMDCDMVFEDHLVNYPG